MLLHLCIHRDNKACSWEEQLALLSGCQRCFPILGILKCFHWTQYQQYFLKGTLGEGPEILHLMKTEQCWQISQWWEILISTFLLHKPVCSAICLKHDVISIELLFLNFFLKWNLETCPCISDSMGSLCSWIVLLNCSQGVALKFSDACIRSKTFLFLDPISCKCLGSCGTTSCAQICPI